MKNTNQNLKNPDLAQFFVAGEAAEVIGCSASTVRRIANELGIPLARTLHSTRILTRAQVDAIAVELARRRQETQV